MNYFRFKGNFEDATCNYNRYVDIQQGCAEKLMARLSSDIIEAHSFVDIRAGTGFAAHGLFKHIDTGYFQEFTQCFNSLDEQCQAFPLV